MSPKEFLHALARRSGFELRRIGVPASPFIPYLRHYDLDYGAERPCSFDFWISNKSASQWYDEWFFAADDPVWELHQFCKLVRPGDHVLEIGCHHGFLTMQLAHLVGPSGSIVALDANPENVIIAQSNVALNKLANVDVLFAAGGERGGSGMFEWKTNSHQVTGAPSTSSYKAEIVTADSLAERFNRDFDVLKLDVEGFECEVLRGAKNILQSQPNLILEVHPNEMREWKADGNIAELCKLIHADKYDGTIICRPDFGNAVPFTPTSIPLDTVSNLHLRPKSLGRT